MLNIVELVSGYQKGSRVLDGFSMSIAPGEIVALMGRNGMGKTTLLKTITGHVATTSGELTLNDRSIVGCEPYQVCAAGIGYVPQGREIFKDFTVEENLLVAALGNRKIPNEVPDWAFETFEIIRERRNQRAGTLSGGQQQQLAIMRALVGQPKLLLLDEPSEGIQPSIVHEIGHVLSRIARERGLAILLVEQNPDLVSVMAGRCVFIENGRNVEEMLDIRQLRENPGLLHRYLSA